ncbi:hypothetical protein [Azorhizophilus paspali]|uniref:Uncharacterized protein n=1 Tax=Azorhizophilus paspali TaxID=69963 RepID=A0ABV6SNG5_AZOPA
MILWGSLRIRPLTLKALAGIPAGLQERMHPRSSASFPRQALWKDWPSGYSFGTGAFDDKAGMKDVKQALRQGGEIRAGRPIEMSETPPVGPDKKRLRTGHRFHS